ncbi:hypothetical protein M011DRAFT_407591 [Sporormia fimetaria CBS 119925]|uniref:Alpha and gamma adaptin binding protein p34 n=1 Tax=Sporormia fimetaria CBS 119925 TaxID=1340428 RepID=A0A6A6V784_9PLEO|nr:hypothetical protein M011DRAFT_407591 [Sporormia fimetaria CBS 119925]
MDIKNPRRILVLGAPDAGVLNLLKDLTGSAPALVSDSTAGLSHTWDVTTRYYTASLPIWIDELHDVEEWRSDFTKPEAKEVVSVVGAWVFCFRKPVDEEGLSNVKSALKAITEVIEASQGYSGDSLCLAVAMPQSMTPHLAKSAEEWEELCFDYDFEFVDSEAKGKNEFGEAVGIKRLEEAVKSHQWEGDEALELSGDDDFGESFGAEEAEMGLEIFGLKAAVQGMEDEESEAQVEELEAMIKRMAAVKEMGEGMPETERKRFAARAVNDLMKDF